jgi:hypothetical protein
MTASEDGGPDEGGLPTWASGHVSTPALPHRRRTAVDFGDNCEEGIADRRRMRPSEQMATAREPTELRRWADLTVIHRAFEARMPALERARIGLGEVAELCRRDYVSSPARDCNDVRDQLLLIGTEWDLSSDRLERQSDACVGAIATFLRGGRRL